MKKNSAIKYVENSEINNYGSSSNREGPRKLTQTAKPNPLTFNELTFKTPVKNESVSDMEQCSSVSNSFKKNRAMLRKDQFGNLIIKGNKKHKIVFADQLKSANKSDLVIVYQIESYKKYN